jgi:hypothetical protein
MCAAILNHAASPIRPPHHVVVQKEKSSKEKEKKLTVQPIRIAQVSSDGSNIATMGRKKGLNNFLYLFGCHGFASILYALWRYTFQTSVRLYMHLYRLCAFFVNVYCFGRLM